MPRPRKQSDSPLSRYVSFRVSEARYADVEAIASRAGMRVNELARRLFHRGSRRVTVQVTRRVDPALITELRYIGNNLNQVVRNIHLRGRIPSKLEDLCAEIQRIVVAAAQDEDRG